ncbi:MAG: class I SAM-dependent methyltransferase [Verrucomicrobiia bacterium]
MKRSFDNMAGSYARLESLTFGKSLQHARGHALSAFDAKQPQKALLLGDGDGRFACRALQDNPLLQIDSIDISASMIHCAKTRIGTLDPELLRRYNPINANALNYEYPLSKYDVVVTQFFLDCFRSDQANQLIAKLETTIKLNGEFAYADFSIPKKRTSKFAGRFLVAILYHCFRLTTDIRANRLPTLEWPESLELETKAEFLKGLLTCEIRTKR